MTFNYLPKDAWPAFTSVTAESEERGTVTLLPGGRFILGCPRDSNEEERAMAKDALIRFVQDSTRGETLPFPVDVVDLRLRA